jgi:hypothetical protein
MLLGHSLADAVKNEWPMLLLIGVPVLVAVVSFLFLLFRFLWWLAGRPRKDPES